MYSSFLGAKGVLDNFFAGHPTPHKE